MMARPSRRRRWLLGAAAVLLVVAQLIPVEHDNPPVTGEIAAPADVAALLRRACYDCHSHATRWPWYSALAPASWLIAHDVDEGRDELDFSVWAAYPPAKQRKKLRKTAEQIEEGEMPLWYYLLLHPEARLTAAEQARLVAWARAEGAPPARAGGSQPAASP
jgi:hypothetical protein